MYKMILAAHSGWAYVALLMVVIATVNALIGSSSRKAFGDNDRRLSLFALIAVHLQFVIGLLLYFTSPNGLEKINAVGMAGMTAMDRLLALEHPLVNVIGVILITIGWSKHKRAENKFKPFAIFYTIAALLFLSRIPWQNWFA